MEHDREFSIDSAYAMLFNATPSEAHEKERPLEEEMEEEGLGGCLWSIGGRVIVTTSFTFSIYCQPNQNIPQSSPAASINILFVSSRWCVVLTYDSLAAEMIKRPKSGRKEAGGGKVEDDWKLQGSKIPSDSIPFGGWRLFFLLTLDDWGRTNHHQMAPRIRKGKQMQMISRRRSN